MTKETDNSKQHDKDHNLSLGNYLQRERQKKKLSIKEISQDTKVPVEALKALEDGNKKQLPVTVFTKGFVKIYGQYLGLNQNDILNRFQKEWVNDSDDESPEMLREESMAQISPFYLSFQFYLIIVTMLTLLGLAYFFFNANDPNSLDISLNSVREMQALPSAITSKQERISISQIKDEVIAVNQILISPKSAGKLEKENDSEEVIIAMHEQVKFTPQQKETLPKQAQIITNEIKARTEGITEAQNIRATAEHVEVIEEILPEKLIEDETLDLHIAFLARTKISISQDEEQPSKYIFSTGEESTWKADKTISMQVEKSENIRITLNGKIVSLPKSHGTPLAITLPTDLSKL